jgi:type IV pilus assembly protein PilO
MAFDALKSIDKRMWIILGSAVGLALLAGYYFMVVSPKQEEIGRLTAEARRLANEVAEKRKIAEVMPQLEREVAALEVQLKEVLVKLPEEKEIPNLLTQVSSLGQQAGLEFTAFRPGAILPRDFYSEVPINLRVEGSYHTLGNFFDRVSKLPRIVTIGDIKVSTTTTKKAPDRTIAADFGVVTYTYGGAPAKADAKGAPAKAKK